MSGRRVLLVVRSGERPFPAGELAGLELLERVTHAIETVSPDSLSLSASGRFDFVIVTSRAAAERLDALGDVRRAGRIIAVGPATADRLRSLLSAEVEEAGGSARAVLERVPGDLGGARVLLPRGDDADEELPRELERRGAEVVRAILYRKVAAPYDRGLDERIRAGEIAVFCATSPAAARWLLDGAAPDAAIGLRSTPAVALGASTRAELDARGVERIEIAHPPTFETAARLALRLAAPRTPA